MATNGFQASYANDGTVGTAQGVEAGPDLDKYASSSSILNQFNSNEDLKEMLDSNRDNLKLDAMKRIISMVAKGKDASDLFPAVVKNVVSKNIEVKKLVYVYLSRYAEEQQDLALLSISTFQRALKDPNQLIRASALRVLSSIRVTMIVPIMMLAIKEAVMDMSPYVRKTAAHAIPKLYSLDPEQKELLIEVIEKLLADKTTLVAGSAIEAFEEVCPDRIDLIHKNYRKLCNLLVDVEEWGQVVIINMLTRYCRSQFINPNADDVELDSDKNFYDSSASSSDTESGDEGKDDKESQPVRKPYMMDHDHRLLLKTCRPLLNSRNAAVVMAVAQLYHHCAPRHEVGLVAKALIRLLRGSREIQYIVLCNIASMSVQRKGMFEPFLKNFYVRSNDPTQVKLLKLEILTNLATETNISTILREFQTYVTSSDKEFATSTIQAIGRCASNISEVTDICLNGLVTLLANRDEAVVGESVVVIKKLLQMRPSQHKEIIVHLARLVDTLTVPMARASILWLIGEYSDRVPRIAPDVLRLTAKTFVEEDDIVKLQILNLAAKLCITNAKQTKLLCVYVFNMAKYDQNYDIRDRVRFLRQLILPAEKSGVLAKHAKKIFLATKPAPVLESQYKDHGNYQLGTLSHLINNKTAGYQELPDWPETAPDPTVRNVEVVMPWTDGKATKKTKKFEKHKSFYSDQESDSSGTTSGADSTASDASDESDSNESSSSSGDKSSSNDSSQSDDSSQQSTSSDEDGEQSEEESSESDSEALKAVQRAKRKQQQLITSNTRSKSAYEAMPSSSEASSSDDSDDMSDSNEDSDSDDDSGSESEPTPAPPPQPKPAAKHPPGSSKHAKVKESGKKKSKSQPASNSTDLLLDLDFSAPSAPGTVASPPSGMLGGATSTVPVFDMLTPSAPSTLPQAKAQPNYSNMMMAPASTPTTTYELLNRITGAGLSASYKFTRTVSVFSPKMISIEIQFTNNSDKPMNNLQITDKKVQAGMEIQDFPIITKLAPGSTEVAVIGVNFNDTIQPAHFTLSTTQKQCPVSINPPVGELITPFTVTENSFMEMKKKLTGMTEHQGSTQLSSDDSGKCDAQALCAAVFEVTNSVQVPSSTDQLYLFAARTVSASADVLISIQIADGQAKITVNCEKMVIGSMLVKNIKAALAKL